MTIGGQDGFYPLGVEGLKRLYSIHFENVVFYLMPTQNQKFIFKAVIGRHYCCLLRIARLFILGMANSEDTNFLH